MLGWCALYCIASIDRHWWHEVGLRPDCDSVKHLCTSSLRPSSLHVRALRSVTARHFSPLQAPWVVAFVLLKLTTGHTPSRPHWSWFNNFNWLFVWPHSNLQRPCSLLMLATHPPIHTPRPTPGRGVPCTTHACLFCACRFECQPKTPHVPDTG